MKLAKRESRRSGSLAPASRVTSPFWPVTRLYDNIGRLFEDPFSELLAPATSLVEGEWIPTIDVREDKNNVYVSVELPGLKKEDINVSISGDELSISGEREEEAEYKGAESYRAERYFGRFQRSISLPVSVEPDKIHAEYKDGVLTVTCTKTEEAKRKQIEIKVD